MANVTINLIPAAPPLWRRYFAYLTVALMPLSFNVEHLAHARAKTYLSPLDLLLPILLLLLLGDILKRKAWVRFKAPPLPCLLWAGWALLSCFWLASGSAAEALKAWTKGPLFFVVVSVWVFQNIAPSAAEFRRLALILGASFSVCLLLALKQYAGHAGLPYNPGQPLQDLGGASNIRVAGWYGFRAMFGAQAAMLIPAAAAFAILDKDTAVRWSALAFAILALGVTLAIGGFCGACAGIIAVAGACAVRHSWRMSLIVLTMLLAFIIILLPQLPRENAAVLLRGFSPYAEDEGKIKPTAHLRRRQAALDLLAAPSDPQKKDSPPFWLKGAGLDQYQTQINRFYKEPYLKPGHRTDDEAAFDMEADEPFTWSLLETVAVELGAPGLLLVLFLFGHWILSAYDGFAHPAGAAAERSTTAMLALAAAGVACGALGLSFFGSPMLRGIGGSFAFFYALALNMRGGGNSRPTANN